MSELGFKEIERIYNSTMHFMNRKTLYSKQNFQDPESYTSKLTPCKDEVNA